MANHFFFNIMRKIIVQTLDIFNNVTIGKYSTSGEIEKFVKVPLIFSSKTKQWYFQQSKRETDGLYIHDQIFPKMSIALTNMEFAQDRMVNNLQQIVISKNLETLSSHLVPIPYNYQFSLDIAAQYMVDITQILEQILPWFNPYVFIRIQVPELNINSENDSDDSNEDGSEALDLKVLYTGGGAEMPVDIDLADMRVLLWNLSFEVHGYLFQPIQETPYVKKIISSTYSMGTSAVSGSELGIGITSNTSDVKYDDDTKILFDYERG